MVIGCGGSGKSVLSRQLGEITGLPVVHLDALNWHADWVATPKEEWQRKVQSLASADRWIIDGNYGGTLRPRLERADTVIFLDFPRWRCLGRVIKRRFAYRNASRPDVGPGCRERLRFDFLKWIWGFRKTRRPRILEMLSTPLAGRIVHVLRGPGDVRSFLASIREGSQ